MSARLFAYPRVGRAGLGNCLFPWARAELFARQTDAKLLQPDWGALRLGPWLRGEPEKRTYGGLFQTEHHLSGWRKALVLIACRRLPEEKAAALRSHAGNGLRPWVVEFNGVHDLFASLVGQQRFLRERLWAMTAPRLLRDINGYGDRFLAMHVRRGDLTRQGFTQAQLDHDVLQYTPVAWFASMARQVRGDKRLDRLPLVVFTDGEVEEVRELLDMPGVRLHERRSAISDLLSLSTASVLFASGYSTFSMWASFLGGMPTLYAPGKMQQRVQAGQPGSVEVELAADEQIPEQIMARLL